MAGALIGTVAAALVFGACYRWFGPDGYRVTLLLALLFGCGVAWLALRIANSTLAIEDVGLLLSECRLCIACGYDLSGSPPEADGCTVCGECGTAVQLLPVSTGAASSSVGSDAPAPPA